MYQYFVYILSLIPNNNPSKISGREENDSRNYFMINLYESMGLGQDQTRDLWICSLTHICSQIRYRLCYAASDAIKVYICIMLQYFFVAFSWHLYIMLHYFFVAFYWRLYIMLPYFFVFFSWRFYILLQYFCGFSMAFSISGPCGFNLFLGASKGAIASGFGFKGPQLTVKSDSLVDIEPGIELGTLGTRRVTYQLHHANS